MTPPKRNVRNLRETSGPSCGALCPAIGIGTPAFCMKPGRHTGPHGTSATYDFGGAFLRCWIEWVWE